MVLHSELEWCRQKLRAAIVPQDLLSGWVSSPPYSFYTSVSILILLQMWGKRRPDCFYGSHHFKQHRNNWNYVKLQHPFTFPARIQRTHVEPNCSPHPSQSSSASSEIQLSHHILRSFSTFKETELWRRPVPKEPLLEGDCFLIASKLVESLQREQCS